MASANDSTLSGDPLVGVAKDWAGKTPARELCMELFCRTLQLSTALKYLCNRLGITIDEAARRGANEMIEEMGLGVASARPRQQDTQEEQHNGAPSNTSDTGH